MGAKTINMIQDNKDQNTHYEIPINISDREINAIQNVLDTYWEQERKDCKIMLFENYGEEVLVDGEEHGHIYDELVVLQRLLDKINKR